MPPGSTPTSVQVQVRLQAHGLVRQVDSAHLRLAPGGEAGTAQCIADAPTNNSSSSSGLTIQVPPPSKRQRRPSRPSRPSGASVSTPQDESPVATPPARVTTPPALSPGATPPSEPSATPQPLARTASGGSSGGTSLRRAGSSLIEVTAQLQLSEAGQQQVRLVVPAGASGGQTLLMNVQRPPELVQVSVPDGSLPGDTLVVYTAAGQPAHIQIPTSLQQGDNLLVSLPLPPQAVHVTLPTEARPGKRIQFPLPQPVPMDAEQVETPKLEAPPPERVRERDRDRSRDRERDRSRERRRSSDVATQGAGGCSCSSSSPGMGAGSSSRHAIGRSPRVAARQARDPTADETAQDEEHARLAARLRAFDMSGSRNEPASLAELRQMPETFDLWLRLQVRQAWSLTQHGLSLSP